MDFHVAQLLKERVGSTRSYKISRSTEGIEGLSPGYRLEGQVRLLRTDEAILVQGTLRTQTCQTCSRCLEEFELPLTLTLEEEYFPSIDVLTGMPLPAPEDPCAFLIDEKHILDLGEAVRQRALIAIPMQPLCRPDCAGLCPVCGCNLNLEHCLCPQPSHESPLAVLERMVASGMIQLANTGKD